MNRSPRLLSTIAPILAFGVGIGCEDDELILATGALEVEVRNVRQEAQGLRVEVTAVDGSAPVAQEIEVDRPSTFATFDTVTVGSAVAKVVALGSSATPLDSVTVHGILVFTDQLSRIVVDFALRDPPLPTPEEVCNGRDDDSDGHIDEGVAVLCGICKPDGAIDLAEDDPLCGEIPCDALNSFTLSGDNTASGRSECRQDRYPPLTSNRCLEVGRCRPPHDPNHCGPPEATVAMEALLCHTITGCTGQTPPSLVVVADGTPCGPADICESGSCVPDVPPQPTDNSGCSDGEREGFIDETTYPNIAACSGGWSVPGTRSTLSPACNRVSGDDSTNQAGTGCNVADLCASGWHVCADKEDVAASSPTGCSGSADPNARNEVLFITRQRSHNNIVCEDRAVATGINDLIGCGNLGTLLDASKNCAPLDRALASQHDGACDFNEAEPPLGPWVCGPSSVAESEHVVKQGSEKGGVLCCRASGN